MATADVVNLVAPVTGEVSAHKHCSHCKHGPGYATPLDAYNHGSREELLYIPTIVPDKSRPDYLVTVDVKEGSETFGQIIHRLHLKYLGDELHHSGWNSCSSCFLRPDAPSRKLLVLPSLNSGRVYGIDTATDPRAPTVAAIAEPEEIQAATGQSILHTSHCEPGGHIMISSLGNGAGEPAGTFLLLDQNLKVTGTWSSEKTPFGYDFWYQPRVNAMVSSEWGDPRKFSKGFNPADVAAGDYGSRITFWDWKERRRTQDLDLGPDGLIPLEVRFLHEPSQAQGFVGAALSSNVIRFHREGEDNSNWKHEVVIRQPWVKVESWVLPELPPLITDILISLDDRFLYFSNWLRGDLVQYDISDPANPRLVGRVWLGGTLVKEGIKVLGGLPEDTPEVPPAPVVKGVRVRGGPQMIQLSLDGKRLYVTNSLYSAWDRQFYPELEQQGSHLLRVHVDTEKGGLTLDEDFLVDFGKEPEGPVLAHEVRYPGGDCSSDIWI